MSAPSLVRRLLAGATLAMCLLAAPSRGLAQLPAGPDPLVDVLFVYNDEARAFMAEAQGGLETAVSSAIAQLNTLLEDSGARSRVRFAGAERVALPALDPEWTLEWLRGSPGGDLAILRDRAQADIVFVLQPWVDYQAPCHAASTLGAYDLRGAARGHLAAGVGVCQFSQAVLRVLGIGRFPGAGDATRPYGYGFIGTTSDFAYATVLAAEWCGVDCRSVERLSSPALTAFDRPLGTPDASDAVRAVDEGALFVSSYRGCSYEVTGPTAIAAPATGGAYGFAVATDASCASGLPDDLDAWVSLGPQADTLRRGSVSFTLQVEPNPGYLARTTQVSIGQRTVSITQAPVNDGVCQAADLRPTTVVAEGELGRASFEYRAPLGCRIFREEIVTDALGQPLPIRADTGWRGLGDAWVPVSLEIGRNAASTPRVVEMTIASTPLRVTQASAACTLVLPAPSFVFSDGAQAISAGVTLPSACAWTITGLPAWATLETPASGIGPASIFLRVTRNSGGSRSASVLFTTGGVAHRMPVSQQGTTCTPLGLGVPSFSASGGGADASVMFLGNGSTCAWSIDDVPSWVTISPTSGVGPASVRVVVAPNAGAARTATVVLAGAFSDIWQAGLQPCPADVTLPTEALTPAGGLGSVQVRTRSDCQWGGVFGQWARALHPAIQQGDGTYVLQVDPNPGYDRSEEVILTPGAAPVALTQAGALGPFPTTACAAGALSANTLGSGAHALRLNVYLRYNCAWNVKVSDSWINLVAPVIGVGPASIPVFVALNASGVARTGWIEVNTHRLTITQAPLLTCVYRGISQPVLPGGGTSQVTMSAVRGCPWNAPTDTGVPWLTIVEPGRGYAGSATFAVTTLPNTSGADRTATLAIAGQEIRLTQYPDPACRLSFVPGSAIVPSAGADLDVLFTMGDSCPWVANAGASWIALGGATQGTGSGRLRVTAGASAFELARVGRVLVNGQAFAVNQEPFVPSAPARQFLAEGATGAFFDTTIALLNPYLVPVPATLTFLRSGYGPLAHSVTLPPRTRVDVHPRTLPGLAQAEFSTVIDAERPIAVDRTMRWGGGYGSHTETGIPTPGLTWYLAEGATMGGFNLFYLLQNPSTTDADVLVTYLRGGGLPPLEKTYRVAANSRHNIWVDVEQFDTSAGIAAALAASEVSGVVASTNGVPIIVERAMYLDRPGQPFAAGHNSAGITAPALEWFLAEGATGAYFDMFVLVANPTDTTAQVRVEYLRAAGAPLVKTYDVPGRSRFNIWVDQEEFDGLGKALADAAVSMTLTSSNGVPIVVERAMWWPGDGASWHEAHNSRGATQAGTRWAIAAGERDDATGTDTFVLVANTSDHEARVSATYLFGDGFAAMTFLTLPPKSRGNMPFPAVRLEGPLRFGVIVESDTLEDGRAAQIVVERATYADHGAVRWAAGANALATRLPEP